jgi:hypothetical protein
MNNAGIFPLLAISDMITYFIAFGNDGFYVLYNIFTPEQYICPMEKPAGMVYFIKERRGIFQVIHANEQYLKRSSYFSKKRIPYSGYFI